MKFQVRFFKSTLMALALILAGYASLFAQPVLPQPVLSAPADASSQDPAGVLLQWGASAGADWYNIQIATDNSFSSIADSFSTASLSYSLTGLTEGERYYWRVRAWSTITSDSSDCTAAFNFTTQLSLPVLSSPANNSYQAALQPSLAWNAVTAAAQYRLQAASDAGFSTIIFDTLTTSTTASLSGLQFNTSYYWRIKALNGNDSSVFSSGFSFTTLLATPVLISPTQYSYGAVLTPTVNWSAVSGATAYRVQLSADSTFAVIDHDDTVTVNTIAYTGLANNTHYYWRVQAQNAVNEGAFSAIRRFTTKLTVATLSAPADGAVDRTTSLGFSWGAVSGANRYQIQVATDSAFSNIVRNVSGLTTNSSIISGLSYWQWYYWRVKATHTSGNFGDFSPAFRFQTKIAPTTLVSPLANATLISINPTLVWRRDTAAVNYHVQLSMNNSFAVTIIDSVITDTSVFIEPILANNTLYYWRVRSMNAVSTGDYSTRAFTTVPEIIPYPSHPLGGQLVYTLQPTLYWYINVPAPGIQYDVLYSTDPTVPLLSSTIADAADSIFYRIGSDLLPGTKYYWRVRSKYAGPVYVKYSAIDSFTTYGASVAPTPGYPLTGNTVHTRSPILRWYMNLHVPFYTFEYRYRLNGSPVWADTVTVGSDLLDTLSNLTAGAAYDWEVRTNNSNTYSSWTATQTFTVDGTTTSAPGTPMLAYPVANASVYTTAPTLYWYVTGNTTGLSYDVEVRTDTAFTGVPTLAGISAWHTLYTNLLPGQTYYWRARSGNGLVYSSWSAADTFTVTAPAAAAVPVLAYPVDSTGVYTSTPTLFFYTNTYTAGTTYDVQLNINDTVSAPLLTLTGLNNSFVSVPASLAAGRTFYWRARAVNGSNTSVWSSFEDFYTAGSAGTLVPVATWPVGGATITDTTSAAISWYVNGYSVQNLTYQMELRTNSSFSGTATHAGITSPATISGLIPGTTYYYRLRSYNGNAYSSWSAAESFTTGVSAIAPSSVQIGAPYGGVTLSTAAPVLSYFTAAPTSGAVHYIVEYADNQAFTNPVIVDNGNHKTVKLNGLANKPYFWRVKALGNNGVYSAYSNTAQFVINSTTGIQNSKPIPTEFFVAQNFPNPFNPSTIIRFGLPADERVSLKVYNTLGQEVARIINGELLHAGTYEYSFDGRSLAAGVYIYRLETGTHQVVKKMLFVK